MASRNRSVHDTFVEKTLEAVERKSKKQRKSDPPREKRHKKRERKRNESRKHDPEKPGRQFRWSVKHSVLQKTLCRKNRSKPGGSLIDRPGAKATLKRRVWKEGPDAFSEGVECVTINRQRSFTWAGTELCERESLNL